MSTNSASGSCPVHLCMIVAFGKCARISKHAPGYSLVHVSAIPTTCVLGEAQNGVGPDLVGELQNYVSIIAVPLYWCGADVQAPADGGSKHPWQRLPGEAAELMYKLQLFFCWMVKTYC